MESPGRSVLVLGATGLVGRACLRLLLEDAGATRVVVVARRPITDVRSEKLDAHVVDFDRLESYADLFAVDQVFCA